MMEWNDKQFISAAQARIDTGCKNAAEYAEKYAKQKVRVRSGVIQSAIETKQSQYKNGGYIVGVFDSQSESFEKSTGAKAVYLEYGHAAPNQGRSSVKRKEVQKHVKPYPFLRPAMRSIKRRQNQFFEDIL